MFFLLSGRESSLFWLLRVGRGFLLWASSLVSSLMRGSTLLFLFCRQRFFPFWDCIPCLCCLGRRMAPSSVMLPDLEGGRRGVKGACALTGKSPRLRLLRGVIDIRKKGKEVGFKRI